MTFLKSPFGEDDVFADRWTCVQPQAQLQEPRVR